MSNEYTPLIAPPPPMFTGKKERDFVKQLDDEVIERIVGQQVVYYPIDLEHTKFHPLYGEAINKSFLNPIQVFALIRWDGFEITNENGLIDKLSTITVHFNKRRLVEDKDLYVREGDFVVYGTKFYEIVTAQEPRETFGQFWNKTEIEAKCIESREGLFNGK